MNTLRFAFAGDRDIAVWVLDFLLSQNALPVVLLIPDELKASHARELRGRCSFLAEERILVGSKFREPEAIELLRDLKLDYIIGIHFPYIVPESVLEVSGRGFLNLHPAYLPYDRGWHTASWAILEGTAAGATLHFMDKGLDTGDIILQKQSPVAEDDTADTLYRKLKLLELEVFRAAWPQIRCGEPARIPQDPNAGTLHKRKDLLQPQIQEIDLDKRTSARELLARLRALTTDRLDEAAYFQTDGTRHRVQIEITREPDPASPHEKSTKAGYQRSLALQRLVFDRMLSADLDESLHKTCLACAENHKNETGLIDFFCGLYLHFQDELTRHFQGDFAALLEGNLPKRRCGRLGLVPESILYQASSQGDSAEAAYMSNLRLSEDVLRLLWLSARLANAVGKKPSLKDVLAAVSLDRAWIDELRRAGLEPRHSVADFESEVETVVFHSTAHSNGTKPKLEEFRHDGSIYPPYTLELVTPSGGFQPVRAARMKLNGDKVAEIAWSEKPTAKVQVELRRENKIEFEIEGPDFASLEVTIRGARPQVQSLAETSIIIPAT